MIISTNNSSGEEHWLHTGRGFTPFTTTNLSRAKGELTKCKKRIGRTYRLVKIESIKDELF